MITGDVISVDEVDMRKPIAQHNKDIDHFAEEHKHNGRVKLVQELNETRIEPAESPQSPQATAAAPQLAAPSRPGTSRFVINLSKNCICGDLDGVLNSNTVGITSPKHNTISVA